MPSLQFDAPRTYDVDTKRRLARRMGVAYAEIMQAEPRLVTVAVHDLGPGSVWRCTDDEPEEAALLMCDVRAGRSTEARAALARAPIAICSETGDIDPSLIKVEFTQHAGEDMYHSFLGGFNDDWVAAEPQPDDKDWTVVLSEPCPECGFDADALTGSDVPDRVRGLVPQYVAVLAGPDVRLRPSPQVWSPLEYGCHVRDVCLRFDERFAMMLEQDDPEFYNWDQDRTAIEDRYREQDPAVVSEQFQAAARALADRLAAVHGAQWERTGRRSNGSVFTVDSFARYLLPALVHHAVHVGAVTT